MGPVAELIFRPRVFELFAGTMALLLFTIPACVVLGVGAAWLVERTDLPGRRAWAVLLAAPLVVPSLRHQLRLDHDLPVTGRVGCRGPRRDVVVLPADLPAGRGPLRRLDPPSRRSPPAWVAARSQRSIFGSTGRSSGCRSSVAGCWSVCTCWPNTAPSRCSASTPSPRRSSSSTDRRSTARPPLRWQACSSSAALRCCCSRTPRVGTGGTPGSAPARLALSVGSGSGGCVSPPWPRPPRWSCWPSACRCSAWPAGSRSAGSTSGPTPISSRRVRPRHWPPGARSWPLSCRCRSRCSSSATRRGPAGRSRRPTT